MTGNEGTLEEMLEMLEATTRHLELKNKYTSEARQVCTAKPSTSIYNFASNRQEVYDKHKSLRADSQGPAGFKLNSGDPRQIRCSGGGSRLVNDKYLAVSGAGITLGPNGCHIWDHDSPQRALVRHLEHEAWRQSPSYLTALHADPFMVEAAAAALSCSNAGGVLLDPWMEGVFGREEPERRVSASVECHHPTERLQHRHTQVAAAGGVSSSSSSAKAQRDSSALRASDPAPRVSFHISPKRSREEPSRRHQRPLSAFGRCTGRHSMSGPAPLTLTRPYPPDISPSRHIRCATSPHRASPPISPVWETQVRLDATGPPPAASADAAAGAGVETECTSAGEAEDLLPSATTTGGVHTSEDTAASLQEGPGGVRVPSSSSIPHTPGGSTLMPDLGPLNALGLSESTGHQHQHPGGTLRSSAHGGGPEWRGLMDPPNWEVNTDWGQGENMAAQAKPKFAFGRSTTNYDWSRPKELKLTVPLEPNLHSKKRRSKKEPPQAPVLVPPPLPAEDPQTLQDIRVVEREIAKNQKAKLEEYNKREAMIVDLMTNGRWSTDRVKKVSTTSLKIHS